jgi:hypothetical protein
MILNTLDLRNTTIGNSKSVKAAKERIEKIFGLSNQEKIQIVVME